MNVETYQNSKEFRNEVSQLGFYVAMISWGMLFAALFLSYALYRFRETAWPPLGFEQISLFWPSLSTALILVSSLFYYFYERGYKEKQIQTGRVFYCLSLLLGAGFLFSQKILWENLENHGMYAGSGIFASIVYGFTWIHAGHVFLGVLALFYALPTLRVSKFGSEELEMRVRNVGRFWHFLGFVWILMFISLFLI